MSIPKQLIKHFQKDQNCNLKFFIRMLDHIAHRLVMLMMSPVKSKDAH
jgi:hypothetical protein